MKKTPLLIAAIAAGLVVTAAEARGPDTAFGAGFGAGAPDFAQLDADGDGQLTRDEIAASMQAMAADRFAAADADGSGTVDATELLAAQDRMRAEAMIARLDSDGDGVLSQEEMTARMATQFEANAERRAQMFARFDADDDGVVSEQEYRTALSFLQGMGPRDGGFGRHGDQGRHAPFGAERSNR